jgi:hypothetical protein
MKDDQDFDYYKTLNIKLEELYTEIINVEEGYENNSWNLKVPESFREDTYPVCIRPKFKDKEIKLELEALT